MVERRFSSGKFRPTHQILITCKPSEWNERYKELNAENVIKHGRTLPNR